jgi:hypothetical protein
MELKEAIKIAEEIRDVAAVMAKTPQSVAMDVLSQHAKQPVQVTDEMVEAGARAISLRNGFDPDKPMGCYRDAKQWTLFAKEAKTV